MNRKRIWLGVSGVLACTYLAHVLRSKFSDVLGSHSQLDIGELGEFLLFLASMLALTVAIILAERERGASMADDKRPTTLWADLEENAERYFMLACYLFCCAVIIHDVGRRFLLNYSAAWSQETAQYAFIYLGWIGAAFAVKERAHIRFDILVNAIPVRARGVIYALAELATIAFAVIALRYTSETLHSLWQFGAATPVLRVSKIWAEAAVTIGFVLIIWRSLQLLVRDISDLRHGRSAYQGKSLFED